MMIRIKPPFTLLFLFLFAFPAAVLAAVESNGFELVVTTPVETKLENPDLRNPADVWVNDRRCQENHRL